jgi:hypothetical protein
MASHTAPEVGQLNISAVLEDRIPVSSSDVSTVRSRTVTTGLSSEWMPHTVYSREVTAPGYGMMSVPSFVEGASTAPVPNPILVLSHVSTATASTVTPTVFYQQMPLEVGPLTPSSDWVVHGYSQPPTYMSSSSSASSGNECASTVGMESGIRAGRSRQRRAKRDGDNDNGDWEAKLREQEMLRETLLAQFQWARSLQQQDANASEHPGEGGMPALRRAV